MSTCNHEDLTDRGLKRKMSTCNRLDLQTLGSQPVMPKNLPDHCHKPPLEGGRPNTKLGDHGTLNVHYR